MEVSFMGVALATALTMGVTQVVVTLVVMTLAIVWISSLLTDGSFLTSKILVSSLERVPLSGEVACVAGGMAWTFWEEADSAASAAEDSMMRDGMDWLPKPESFATEGLAVEGDWNFPRTILTFSGLAGLGMAMVGAEKFWRKEEDEKIKSLGWKWVAESGLWEPIACPPRDNEGVPGEGFNLTWGFMDWCKRLPFTILILDNCERRVLPALPFESAFNMGKLLREERGTSFGSFGG